MNKEETIKILSILRAVYPNSYKGMSKQEAMGVVTIWVTHFNDVPAEMVLMAINKITATHTFPPTISEVKEKLNEMYYEATMELIMDKSENRLSKDMKKALAAIRDYGYSENKEPTLISLIHNYNLNQIEGN